MSEDINKDGLELLRFLYKHRIKLFISSLLSAVLAIVISLFLDKKYESMATVFPPGFNSAERMLENPQFGYNIEADRLIQIGESADLTDSVIDHFNMIDYYEVDTNDLDWYSKLRKNYQEDVTFDRTKYMSVEIRVRQKDPVLAAEVANKIIDYLSSFWESLFKENMLQSLTYAEKLYFEKEREVNVLLDSIHKLRTANTDASLSKLKNQLDSKHQEVIADLNALSSVRESADFYDYGNQLEILSQEILETNRIIQIEKGKFDALESLNNGRDSSIAMSKGKYEGAKAHVEYLTSEMEKLKKIGKEYDKMSQNLLKSMEHYQELKMTYENTLYSFEPYVQSVDLSFLESRYESEKLVLNELKKKYESAHKFYHQPLPNLFVIEKARANYKKVAPSWLKNGFIAALITFILLSMLIILKDRIEQIKQSVD